MMLLVAVSIKPKVKSMKKREQCLLSTSGSTGTTWLTKTSQVSKGQLKKKKPQTQEFLTSQKPEDWVWDKNKNALNRPRPDALPQLS